MLSLLGHWSSRGILAWTPGGQEVTGGDHHPLATCDFDMETNFVLNVITRCLDRGRPSPRPLFVRFVRARRRYLFKRRDPWRATTLLTQGATPGQPEEREKCRKMRHPNTVTWRARRNNVQIQSANRAKRHCNSKHQLCTLLLSAEWRVNASDLSSPHGENMSIEHVSTDEPSKPRVPNTTYSRGNTQTPKD